MRGRFRGMPPQASFGSSTDDEPQTSDPEPNSQEIPDTPYSGGPDKEAVYTGDDPMQEQAANAERDITDVAQAEGTEDDADEGEAEAEAKVEAKAETADETVEVEADAQVELRAVYQEMTVEELRDEARSMDLSGYSKLNKDELVDLLVGSTVTE